MAGVTLRQRGPADAPRYRALRLERDAFSVDGRYYAKQHRQLFL